MPPASLPADAAMMPGPSAASSGSARHLRERLADVAVVFSGVIERRPYAPVTLTNAAPAASESPR